MAALVVLAVVALAQAVYIRALRDERRRLAMVRDHYREMTTRMGARLDSTTGEREMWRREAALLRARKGVGTFVKEEQ